MRKFMVKAAVLTTVLLLSSCAKGEENVESVTVELTTETSIEQPGETTEQTTAFLADHTVQTSETTETEIETTVSEDETDENAVLINGKEYFYYNDTGLYLNEFEGSVSDCIEKLKELAPKQLTVDALDPTEADSELLMTELRRGYEASLIDENGVWNEYIGGDRGSNVTYWGSIREPFYSDDEQAIIKETDIYYHDDNPYVIIYEERNLRLVNTENGWKVDILQLAF